eukprot:sb/3472793/
MSGTVVDVESRLWANDPSDSKSTVDVALGLTGVNVTAKVGYSAYNEQFKWAWGSKRDIVTGTNAIDRSILDGFVGGKSLVVMQIAERFLSYGPLGMAAPGVLTYVITIESYGVPDKAEVVFESAESDDLKTLRLTVSSIYQLKTEPEQVNNESELVILVT